MRPGSICGKPHGQAEFTACPPTFFETGRIFVVNGKQSAPGRRQGRPAHWQPPIPRAVCGEYGCDGTGGPAPFIPVARTVR